MDDSDYYILNPWAGILGRANETDIEIDGIISKALIDNGAIISMMSKDYCYKCGYEIQPLEYLVPIEGSGGASVPYLEYVGVRMHIPGINSFDRNVLMFVSPTTTQYHQRVPIQVGSCVMNQVINCIPNEELQSLLQSWKMAYVHTIISMATFVSDPEFDLDHVRGKVVTSEDVTIPASQTIVVKGLTMITGHHKHVHVLVEVSPKCVNVLILGNTSELRPGTSEIEIVIQNWSEKDLKIKPGTEIGTIIMANIDLTTQVSNDFNVGEQERVSSMSAQVISTGILEENPDMNDDPKDILHLICLEWKSGTWYVNLLAFSPRMI